MIGLLVSTNKNGKTYNSILVIGNWLTKIVHYKLVNITIYTSVLAKVIINIVICHYNFLDSIIKD